MKSETVVRATRISLILFAVLYVLDVGMTIAGLQRYGFQELNPVALVVMGFLGAGWGLAALSFGSYVVVSVLLLKTLRRAVRSEGVRKAQVGVMTLIGLIKLGAVLNNAFLLIKYS